MATQTINTLKAAQGVINSRAQISASDVNEYRVLTVSGNGSLMDVRTKADELVLSADGTGAVLRKKVFNTKCNNAMAANSPYFKDLCKKAYRFEVAGNTIEAEKAYKELLNGIQVDFGILDNHKLFHAIQDGDQIKGQVIEIRSEKGYSVLTFDPKTISIMKPVVAGKSTIDFTMAISDDASEFENDSDDVVEPTTSNKKVSLPATA